jgi:hypothetical protein
MLHKHDKVAYYASYSFYCRLIITVLSLLFILQFSNGIFLTSFFFFSGKKYELKELGPLSTLGKDLLNIVYMY